jgi:hypothetical protein
LGPRDLAPLMREDSARVRVLFDIGMFTCQQLMVREFGDLRRIGVSGLFCGEILWRGDVTDGILLGG